jgi:hypothetical protein
MRRSNVSLRPTHPRGTAVDTVEPQAPLNERRPAPRPSTCTRMERTRVWRIARWHAGQVLQQEDQQSFMSVTVEWGSVSIAALALVVSIWAAWYSTRRSTSIVEQLSQNDTFMRIHELLIDPQAAGGRRKLFLSFAAGDYPQPGSSDWDDINYSLALYDTLGGYIHHGFVKDHMALASWHDPLVRIAEPARAFAAHRQGDQQKTSLVVSNGSAGCGGGVQQRPGNERNLG